MTSVARLRRAAPRQRPRRRGARRAAGATAHRLRCTAPTEARGCVHPSCAPRRGRAWPARAEPPSQLAPLPRHDVQGIPADAPRSAHVRDDVGVPIMQLVLFGFAINADPRPLPTAVRWRRPEPFTRCSCARSEHQLLRHRRRHVSDAEGGAPGAAARSSSSINIPAEFLARHAPRRPPGAPGGSRCDRSGRHRQRARRARSSCDAARCATTSKGPLAAPPASRAVRLARPPPLQSRGHHRSTTSCRASWA